MKTIYTFFLLSCFGIVASAQSLYFPPNLGNTWETLSPESQGYCPTQVDSLYDFLEAQNSKAFILLKNGKIVLERYFDSFTRDSLWYWASAGKTLTAALVGIAQEEGILSLSDTSSTYLGTGWTSLSQPQEEKITIWHQLTMTTGLDDGVNDLDCTTPNCLTFKADAGSRWAYHNGPYTLLDDVLQAASGTSLNQYFNPRLRNVIGMNGGYVKVGFNSVFFSSPRSMARFGLLLLAKGTWNQTPVIADTAYLYEMTHSSQGLNESYGYLTWLNGQASFMVPRLQTVFPGSMSPAAPADSYAALGKNGQIINVTPSDSIVWIRMGSAPDAGSSLIASSLHNDIWAHIQALSCGITSQERALASTQVRLYPNPTHDRISLEAPYLIEHIMCTDASGKRIQSWDPQATSATLSLEALPAGVYLLRIRLANGRELYQKVMKS